MNKIGGRYKKLQHKRFKQRRFCLHSGILPSWAVAVLILAIGSEIFYLGDFTTQFENAEFSGFTKKDACNIKGNVSYDNRRKIYHVPGQQDYESTVISIQRGERWFCSEADARAGGWKKAGR